MEPQRLAVFNFDEIYLKGKNQRDFIRKLRDNLAEKLRPFREHLHYEGPRGGSYFIRLNGSLTESEISQIERVLATTPGISSFYIAETCRPEVEAIVQTALAIAKRRADAFETFGVVTRRIDRKLPFSAYRVNCAVGDAIGQTLGKKVYLDDPDLRMHIKVRSDRALVYTDLKKGLGGLPVGTSGRAMVLLSGGIDSPVAMYLAMLRGLQPVAVHFHSVPMTSPRSIEKVEAIVQRLTLYHPHIRLLLVPVFDVQQAIVELPNPRYRLILLRRMMLKITEELAKTHRANAIVTGDALGQVATQTPENLRAIQSVTQQWIMRPLIGMSKAQIIALARQIGTYELSIQPHDDTCALFVPKNPVTRAKVEEADRLWNALNASQWVEKLLPQVESREICPAEKDNVRP